MSLLRPCVAFSALEEPSEAVLGTEGSGSFSPSPTGSASTGRQQGFWRGRWKVAAAEGLGCESGPCPGSSAEDCSAPNNRERRRTFETSGRQRQSWAPVTSASWHVSARPGQEHFRLCH